MAVRVKKILGATGPGRTYNLNAQLGIGSVVANGIAAGGGGSGGGSINPFYGGTYTNNGTVRANGGQGGTASGAATNRNGGAGGNGTVTPTKIVAKAI